MIERVQGKPFVKFCILQMAKFCPNLSIADSGHLQIVNIMMQPDFWLGWSIASDKLSHMTQKPTRCWKLAVVVRLNFSRSVIDVIDLKRKCRLFQAFTCVFCLFMQCIYRGLASLSSKSRPFKYKQNNIPTRVTMPPFIYRDVFHFHQFY